MQRRILLLRRTSAESISDCMEGRPTALKVKQLRMDTPPPWSDTPWKVALTGLPRAKPNYPLVATEDRGQRRGFRFFCPWAACVVGSDTTLPGGLDLCKARKYQLTCSGCKARFAAARAACVFCHQPPQVGCTHSAQEAVQHPPPGRKPGAYRGAGACPAGMRPKGPAVDATGLEGRTLPTHFPGSTATQCRQVSLADCWAGRASSEVGGTVPIPTSVGAACTPRRLPASAPTLRVTSGPPGASSVGMPGDLTTPAASDVTEPGKAASPAPWLFRPLPLPRLWLGPLIGACPSPRTSTAWI